MNGAAYIALGTNLPHAGVSGAALLEQAVSALRERGLAVRAMSSVWETPPWPPGADQPNYFNAAAELDAGGLNPQQLYQALREIEARFGRVRRQRWGPRTLDLDILAMEGFEGEFEGVALPHPRMHERRFVLGPLAEVAPDWRHPSLELTVVELLAGLK